MSGRLATAPEQRPVFLVLQPVERSGVLTGIVGASSGSESHDISGFVSADTQVRFRVSNLYGGSDEYFYADNVMIQAE